jgi:hypothetical protein
MKSLTCVGAAFCGALVCASVRAEALYVIEQVVVSVSSTADEAGERVASIHSGDRVDVVERHDGYAHVRLASGTEGWVKATYLSPELPLQQKLTAQTEELDRLKQELSRLQEEASAAKVAAPVARAVQIVPPAVVADERPEPGRAIWQWALGFSALALIGGFVLGWRVLDRRIRRKYGGLRIY